jgi:hypothetical protein
VTRDEALNALEELVPDFSLAVHPAYDILNWPVQPTVARIQQALYDLIRTARQDPETTHTGTMGLDIFIRELHEDDGGGFEVNMGFCVNNWHREV